MTDNEKARATLMALLMGGYRNGITAAQDAGVYDADWFTHVWMDIIRAQRLARNPEDSEAAKWHVTQAGLDFIERGGA